MNNGDAYPPPLPPTWKTEWLRTEVSALSRCCACKKGAGVITCARCKAVKYCDEYCQQNGYRQGAIKGRNGWKEHEETCNNIVKIREQAEAAVKELTAEYKPEFLHSLGIKGEFTTSIDLQDKRDKYIFFRRQLVFAYQKCGVASMSSAAFRLAAENMLDILCLTYSTSRGALERFRYLHCVWMIAGGMDQLALNFLSYFYRRQLAPHSLPYLDLFRSRDEDIEGASYLRWVKKEKSRLFTSQTLHLLLDARHGSTYSWMHDYMLIALIKYKRLQAKLVQRQTDKALWRTFMKGMDPWAGEESVVFKLRGVAPAFERIKFYAVDENITSRIEKLNSQIKQILSVVNVNKKSIIRNIIKPEKMPNFGRYWGSSENRDWTCNDNVHAWNVSSSYVGVLESFLRNGKIMDHSDGEEFSSPLEGFFNAFIEADPSRPYSEEDLDLLQRSNEITMQGIESRNDLRHNLTGSSCGQPHKMRVVGEVPRLQLVAIPIL